MTWFFYALLTALLSSLAALFEKRALNRLHSIDFSAGIAFTSALLTLPILFTSSWEVINVKILLFTFFLSLIASWAFLNITRGVRHMEISLSASLFLLGPLITTLFAFLILGERISVIQIFGMFVLAFGAYILETKTLLEGKVFLQNIWGNVYSRFILLGLFLYGLTSVGDRIVISEWGVPVIFYTALIQLFIALNFVILTWRFRGSPLSSLKLVRHYWVGILVLAILTVGYRTAQGYAVALATSVGLVIAIKRSSSLFTTVIGGELFHDHDIFRKSVACLVMIVGVTLIAL